jgi:hypothetical protein
MKAQICFAANAIARSAGSRNGGVTVEIEDRVPVYLSAHVGIVDSLKRYGKKQLIFDAGAGEGMPAFVTPIADLKKSGSGAIETELGAQVRSVRDEIARFGYTNKHGVLSKRLDRPFERRVELAQIRKFPRRTLFGRINRYKDGFIVILPT